MFDREKLVSLGRDVLDESLWSAWEMEVDDCINDVYGGVDLLNALDVIASVDVGDVREAFDKLGKQDHNVETYANVLRCVYRFSKDGECLHRSINNVY